MGLASRHQFFFKKNRVDIDTAPWTQVAALAPPQLHLPMAALSVSTPTFDTATAAAARMTDEFEPRQFVAIRPSQVQDRSSSSTLKFLCKPIDTMVPEGVNKPGKEHSMLPEMLLNHCWDAYAADGYALGIALFHLFFGVRLVPHSVMFHHIYNGAWIAEQKKRATRHGDIDTYNLAFMRVIDALIKPQHLIAKMDQLLTMDLFTMNLFKVAGAAAVPPSSPPPFSLA
jgi:hypothetical protein